MTTAQKNALAQELARKLVEHFNIPQYVMLQIENKPEISLEDKLDISHRVLTILQTAQIPPELLKSEVRVACPACGGAPVFNPFQDTWGDCPKCKGNWEGEL